MCMSVCHYGYITILCAPVQYIHHNDTKGIPHSVKLIAHMDYMILLYYTFVFTNLVSLCCLLHRQPFMV